jgi:hypothetical protein
MGKIHGSDVAENGEPDDIGKRDEGLAPDRLNGHKTGEILLDHLHTIP